MMDVGAMPKAQFVEHNTGVLGIDRRCLLLDLCFSESLFCRMRVCQNKRRSRKEKDRTRFILPHGLMGSLQPSLDCARNHYRSQALFTTVSIPAGSLIVALLLLIMPVF